MTTSPTWTPEREQLLQKLVEAGRSANEIAIELGDLTRNAVIGKCRRMNLKLSGSLGGRSSTSSNQRRKAAHEAKPRVIKPQPPAPVVEAESQRLTLDALRRNQCHWPTGRENEQYVFCGDHVTYKDYCTYHARLAYVPK